MRFAGGHHPRHGFRGLISALAILLAILAWSLPAHGLSEIQQEDVPPELEDGAETGEPEVIGPIPLPDPIVIPQDPRPGDVTEEAAGPDGDVELPDILYSADLLPEPVQRMRRLIMEAALTGDPEQLRPLLGSGDQQVQLSFGSMSGDPIEFLRQLSGDEEGHEILAILYEVLDAGYVHLDEGTPEELYVWPYFFAVPLDSLDARQRVEMFMLVTAGDYEDMKEYGAYIFYRAGITPDGRWQFFVAGD